MRKLFALVVLLVTLTLSGCATWPYRARTDEERAQIREAQQWLKYHQQQQRVLESLEGANRARLNPHQ
jgi:outer membrane biogenesis lipoprotein LolB